MSNYVKLVPFHNNGSTVSLAVTNSTGNVQYQTAATNGTCTSRTVRLWNSSATIAVFVEFGDVNTVTASATTSMPIPPNTVAVFEAPYQYIAAITASSTSTLYITPGDGG